METILNLTYKQLMGKCKIEEKNPQQGEFVLGIKNIEQYDPMWQQYNYETKDYYNIVAIGKHKCVANVQLNTGLNKFLDTMAARLNNKAQEVQLEIYRADLIELIVCVLYNTLATRTLQEIQLPQKTGDRHALVQEVTDHLTQLNILNDIPLGREHKKKCFLITLCVLETLVDAGIIKKIEINLKNYEVLKATEPVEEQINIEELVEAALEKNKKIKKHVKTIYSYKLKEQIELVFNPIIWKVALIPYSTKILPSNLIYIYGTTFLSLQKVTLENKFSEQHLQLADITILNKLKGLAVYLNPQLYETVKQVQVQEGCATDIPSLLTEIRLKSREFENILRQKTQVYRQAQQKGKNMWGLLVWLKKHQIKIQKVLSRLDVYLDFLLIETQNHLHNKPLYFVYTFDFRGRLYYKSKISPQSSYLFRYLYDYGLKKQKNISEDNLLNLDYNYGSSYISEVLAIKQQKNPQTQRIMVGLIVEFAKISKGQYIEKYEGKFSLQDFINIGLAQLTDLTRYCQDVEKKTQLAYIKKLGVSLVIEDNNQRDYIIYKDATASALQLLSILLIPAKEEIILYVNLNSKDCWYDTYYHVIQLFRAQTQVQLENERYFTRQNLKKTIMTYNYAATYFTCGKYFEESIAEDLAEADIKKKKSVERDFKKFYEFLNDLFNTERFFRTSLEKRSQLLINQYTKTKEIIMKSPDGAKIALHYKKPTLKRGTAQIGSIRKTMQVQELSEIFDAKKTKQAIKPNTTHALDAHLVREVLRDLIEPIITIHDCFGVGVTRVEELLISINKNLNELRLISEDASITRTELFSIFAVL